MMTYIMNDPSVAPAFFLARQGFDVWVGNNRGNRFSDKHTTLDTKSREYWQFDWEEMGLYDQPAVINHILNITGQTQLSYMGHSQGTTQLMAGAALMPEFYNSKIKIAALLAPPIALAHNDIPLLKWASIPFNTHLITGALDKIKFWNIIPYNFMASEAAELLCSILDGKICDLVFSVMDQWHSIDNTDRKDMYVSNLPSGASARCYVHYGQLIHQKEPAFLRYDFGETENMKRYGQATPPAYNISAIEFPIAIASGSLDDLADPKDVAWFAS